MKRVNKPWGYELWFVHNNKYVGKIIFVKKGHRLSKQYHKKKHETHFTLEGKYIMEINGRKRVVKVGQTLEIFPGTVHRMHAKFCDAKIVEISTPEVWDVVRLEDDYGRMAANKNIPCKSKTCKKNLK